MADSIKRTTLIVRDVQKAAQWYEQVFLMERWLDRPITLTGTGLATGKAGDETHLIIMKANDPVIGMIGLLEWVNPKMDAPPVPTRVEFGAPIFVVGSSDAKRACEAARKLGSQIYQDPYEWDIVGADGVKKYMIGVSFFDLDGYFYEVNEVTRTEASE